MNNEIIKTQIWKVGRMVGILLAIFLAIVSIKEFKSISYVGRDTTVADTITVTGKGESISIPDIATFSFSVTETAKTVEDAQTKATNKINSTLKALKDNKIEDKDVKTLSYSINPHYDYVEGSCVSGACRPGKSILTGYDVSQSIQVKVWDIKKAGGLFSTIGSLDVQNVGGLTFSIDDIDKVKEEARDIAIADARMKAVKLAKELGVKLVRITNFIDAKDEPVFPFPMDGMYGGEAVKTASVSTPNIPAGEQKISSRVSITYEIR